MRLTFMDAPRLKKKAQSNIDDGTTRLRRWWSHKYNRPSNDPLFETKTAAEHLREMYEDLMIQRDELREELNNRPTDVSVIVKGIEEINKILGDEEEVVDPLIEEWEAALDRGEEPDI